MPFKITSVMPDLVTGKGRATLIGDDRVAVVITNLDISGLEDLTFSEAEKRIRRQAHEALKGAEAAFSALTADDDDALSAAIAALRPASHIAVDPRQGRRLFNRAKPRR